MFFLHLYVLLFYEFRDTEGILFDMPNHNVSLIGTLTASKKNVSINFYMGHLYNKPLFIFCDIFAKY